MSDQCFDLRLQIWTPILPSLAQSGVKWFDMESGVEDNDIDRNMAGYKKANSISDARNQILVAKEPFFVYHTWIFVLLMPWMTLPILLNCLPFSPGRVALGYPCS